MITSGPLASSIRDAARQAAGVKDGYESDHAGKVFNGKKYAEDLKKSGYTDEEAKQYWSDLSNVDPYSRASKEIAKIASSQTPKVSIENNNVVISAPQKILESPLVAQLNQELKSLKGADLKNPEVANAISALNQELETNAVNSMAQNTLGWTPDEYNDYNTMVQALSVSNPMKSGSLMKWAPKGKLLVDASGEPIKKTPDEWREYWETNYSSDERTDLFYESLQSNNPYERTMALVLAQGSGRPIYGFTPLERAAQGFITAWQQLKKYPEGAFRQYIESEKTKDLENSAKNIGIPVKSLEDVRVSNSRLFNEKKDSIKEFLKDNSYEQLSDEDKAFLLILSKANESHVFQDVANKSSLRSFTGLDIPIFGPAAQILASGEKFLNSLGEQIGARSAEDIIDSVSFDDYKRVRDDYISWQSYGEAAKKDEERLAKNAIWSGASQNIGNIAGTVGRFLWEAAVTRGLTGGINPSSITNPKLVTGEAARTLSGGFNVNDVSNMLGDKISKPLIAFLEKVGASPISPTGQKIIQFTSNLIGTIPEDILQTSMDNIVTYNEQDNADLFNLGQMSENFRNNLIMMSLFNMARVGINSVKRARIAKNLKKIEALNQTIDVDGVLSDTDDLARAIKKGQAPNVDENGRVTIIDENFNEKPLENITSEQAEMVQRSLSDQGQRYIGERRGFDIDSLIEKKASDSWDMEPKDDVSTAAYDRFIRSGIDGDRYRFNSEENNAITRLQSGSAVNEYLIDSEGYVSKYGEANANSVRNDVVELDNSFNSAAKRDLTLYRGSEGFAYPWDSNGRTRINTFVETSYDPNVAFNRTYRAGLSPEKTIVYKIEVPEGQKLFAMPDDIPQGEIVLPRGMEWELTGEKTDLFVDGKKVGEMYTIRPTETIGLESTPVKPVDDGQPQPVSNLMEERLEELASKRQANADAEAPKVAVEVDSPDGPVRVETTDYRPRDLGEALKITPEPTPAGVKQWHTRSLETAMNDFTTHLQNFHDKFGDVRVSDFDWVWYNTKKGLTPEQIVGTTDPTTGRVVTQNMIDAMKWWQEQPTTKDLRMASRGALGLEGDFDVLGYLPHTTYDPATASFEEALTGRGALWQTSTGASVLGDNMQYKGFGGDFDSRYRTFASNMLWDAKTKDIATSKVIEEAQMDGVDLSPERAKVVAEGAESIQKGVDNAASTKEWNKAFESDGDTDFNKITKNTEEEAKNSGVGQSTHDNWGEVYMGQNSAKVEKQRKGVVNSLDTQGNFLRNTQTTDGSMYDNGAADIVYRYGNAVDIVSRYMDPNNTTDVNLRDMMVDYYTSHGRPQKYAEIYADKAMARLGEVPGQLTKVKAINSLATSMKWEAWSRLRRWLVRADYNQFNNSTKKYIDQFLFSHMQLDSIKNNPKITNKLAKALDVMTGLRYRALFYGNIKNALLQTSELNRYFSAFKWGDVAKMAKRLATDEGFRARVDVYVDAVAPRTSQLDANLYGKYADVADSMEVQQDGVKFRDLGKKTKETADAIGLGPIEAAESFKNRMMVAGLVQEADSRGLTGDEALRHIRKRFERVALAADEMGRIGMSSSPLARTALFLQNFQIRELGMHLYNVSDEWKLGKTVPKKIFNSTKYLTKVFGAKLATTLILARLGYSASQTMGLDPFGLLDNYNQMNEDDMNWVDQQIAGGLLTPFFSGGMTSLIADMYFMARNAYEESHQQTVSDEAEERLEDTWGLALPEGMFSWENLFEGARNFIPGNVTANRISQMNELMSTGWATSSTGNKMYTAPTDPVNVALGYLFGRSATRNAQQYNQTYGDNLAQTLGRIFNNVLGRDTQFDPIDTENYSDWFKGDENDAQQFNKGRYWFQAEKNRILDEYESAIKDSYASADEIAEAKNNMNSRLEDLYDKLDRFVDAYEKKNGTITPAMTKQIVNILNTGRNVVTDTPEQAEQRGLEEYGKALERYSQLGMSPVGTYTGPSEYNPEQEVKYQGSPQWRAAISGYYNTDDELVEVLKLADTELEPIRKQLQDKISYAYSSKNYDYLNSLQNQYLKEFDQVVAPIIAAYGVDSIKKNGEVENQLKTMLNSGGLIPSSQYAKNKWGKYQSMPMQEVDVGSWARQRYSSDTYKNPTIRSYSTAEEDLQEIKRLSNAGQKGRATARALELKVRINNQTRSLSSEDLKWLNNFLNNEGDK